MPALMVRFKPRLAKIWHNYGLSGSVCCTASRISDHRRSARRLFAQAVVIPDIVYGSNAFFPALLGRQLDRLGLLQNRAIGAIDGHPRYTTVHPLLVQHGLYRDRRTQQAQATSVCLEVPSRESLCHVTRCLYCSSDLLAGAEPVIRGPVVCSVSHPPLALGLWRFSAVRRRICTLEPATG
eukprot:scpid19184/ scgid12064/ 